MARSRISAVLIMSGAILGIPDVVGAAGKSWKVLSPDGKVALSVVLADRPPSEGAPLLYYSVECEKDAILAYSPLGIARKDQSFAGDLSFEAESPLIAEDSTYEPVHGKRRLVRDRFHQKTLVFRNPGGARVELILRAYDEGAAFRYRFPEESPKEHTVVEEATGFRLPAEPRIWLHPYDKATEYSPAYETYYEDGIPAGTPSPGPEGWAFPVLFRTQRGLWGLLTEAGLDGTYCGCRLRQEAPHGLYRIRFPDEAEGNHTGSAEPSSTLPWATPWRAVLAAKDLSGIVESNLVTNLNPPSIVKDASWIKPGRASWSWLYDHDSPQDFLKLREFVDLAAEFGWEYSLVDANWTVMKNGTIHDLIRHAKEKGVGILLWYNSGGDHNYVSEKPHGLLWHPKIRRKEFQLLRDWGVKGVKVDFFQSDKQNVIRLYHEILRDAADFQIMVNFHGCTLPRGWERTYPHLLSMEAVRGEECYSFDRAFPEKAPRHNATLPFTRNAVGPMDYTPVMFQDNVYPHRTTWAHEIALPVAFESGWLHFADGPGPYRSLPPAPKDFLKRVPVAWDETRLLAGEPGKYAVLARRKGETWYVGGINGEGSPRKVRLELSLLIQGDRSALWIEDGPEGKSLVSRTEAIPAGSTPEVSLRPYGGFVLELVPRR